MSLKWPNKDKDETLDYSLDWSRFLEEGESVVSASWKIRDSSGDKVSFNPTSTVSGLTATSTTFTSSVSTIYLSDGINNTEYKLFCSVTTSSGRTAERPVKIRIREYE